MVMTCAAAVVTGLDQRILDYFGAKPEEERLLAPGFAAVDMTSAADNGAEIHISQTLFDRYHVVLLGELTAPQGTVLDRDDYHFSYSVEPFLANEQLCEEFSGGGGQELKILEDEDPKDEHMSFLLSPVGLVVRLESKEDRFFEFGDAYASQSGSYWWKSITLTDKDGKPVGLKCRRPRMSEDTAWRTSR